MKKITCIVLTLILALAMTIGLTGCGDDKELNGTWEGFRYTVNEYGTKQKTGIVKIHIEKDEIYIMQKDAEETFYSDNGYISVERYTHYEILEDDDIVVFYDDLDYCYEFYYAIVGDNLTLTNNNTILELQRQ